ncbi:PIK-related kinase [Spraguea lophii 42_110]|uniref:PIK-related kinase n=1 Tax=Spraguea lophii (strain 42_110) TaxID=1358809 RepID=S7WDA1_SPRLO|nr:PIK-related kinase [Spraguea lophii 42_110]
MDYDDQKLDTKTRVFKMISWLEEQNSLQYLYRSPDFTSKFVKLAIPLLNELPYNNYKDILEIDDRSIILKIIFRLKNTNAKDSEYILPIIIEIIRKDTYFNRSLVIKCLTGLLRKTKPSDAQIESLFTAIIQFLKQLLTDHFRNPTAEGYLYLFSETLNMLLFTGKNYDMYNRLIIQSDLIDTFSDFINFYLTKEDKALQVLSRSNTSIEFYLAFIKILKFLADNLKFAKISKLIPDGVLFLLNYMPQENFELKQDFYNLIFNLCTNHKELFKQHLEIILCRGLLFKYPSKIVKAQGLSLFMDIIVSDVENIGIEKVYYTFQVLTEILEKELLVHKIDVLKNKEEEGIIKNVIKEQIEVNIEDMTVIELIIKTLSQLLEFMKQKPCSPSDRQTFLLNCFYHYFQLFIFLAEYILRGKKEKEITITKEKIERDSITKDLTKFIFEILKGINAVFLQLEHINKSQGISLSCLTAFTDKDVEIFRSFLNYFIWLSDRTDIPSMEEYAIFFSRIETSLFGDMIEYNLKLLIETTKKNHKLFSLWNALSINASNVVIFTCNLCDYVNVEIKYCTKEEVEFYKLCYNHIFKYFMSFPEHCEIIVIDFVNQFLQLFLTTDPEKVFFYEIILSLFNIFAVNYHKFAGVYKVVYDFLPELMLNVSQLMLSYPNNELFIEILLCIPISVGFLHQHVKEMILPIKRGLRANHYLQNMSLRFLDQLFDLLRPEYLEITIGDDLYDMLHYIHTLLGNPNTKIAAARVLTRIKQHSKKYLEFNGLVEQTCNSDSIIEFKNSDFVIKGNIIIENAIKNLIGGEFEQEIFDVDDRVYIQKYKDIIYTLEEKYPYKESIEMVQKYIEGMLSTNNDLNINNCTLLQKQLFYDSIISLLKANNNKYIDVETKENLNKYIMILYTKLADMILNQEKVYSFLYDTLAEILIVSEKQSLSLYKAIFEHFNDNSKSELFFGNIFKICIGFAYCGYDPNKKICVRGIRVLLKMNLGNHFYEQNKNRILKCLFFYLENTSFPENNMVRDVIFTLLRKTYNQEHYKIDKMFVEGLSSSNENLRQLCQSILEFVSELRGIHVVDLLQEQKELLENNIAYPRLGYASLEELEGMIDCITYLLEFKPYVFPIEEVVNRYVQYITQIIKREQTDLLESQSPAQKRFALASYKFLLTSSVLISSPVLIEALITTFYKGLFSSVQTIVNYSKEGISLFINNETAKQILVAQVQPIYSKFLYDLPSYQVINHIANVFSIFPQYFEHDIIQKALEYMKTDQFFAQSLKIICNAVLTSFYLVDAIEYILIYGRRALVDNKIKSDIIKLAEKNNPAFLKQLLKKANNPITHKFLKCLLSSKQIKKYIQENKDEVRSLALNLTYNERAEPVNLYSFLDLVDISLAPKDITHLIHIYKEMKIQKVNTLTAKKLIRKYIPKFSQEHFTQLFDADPLFIFENVQPLRIDRPMVLQKFIDSTFIPFPNYIADIPISRIADQVIKLYIETNTYDKALLEYYENNTNSMDGLVYRSLFNPKPEYFIILLRGNSEYKDGILKGLNSILKKVITFENSKEILSEYKREILKIIRCEIMYKSQLFIVYPLLLKNRFLVDQDIIIELCDAVCRLFGTFYYIHQIIAVDLMKLIIEWFDENKETEGIQRERIQLMIESIYTLYLCNCCHVKDKNILEYQKNITFHINAQFLIFNFDKIEKSSCLTVVKTELKKDYDNEYKIFLQKNMLEILKVTIVDELVDNKILDLFDEDILKDICENYLLKGEMFKVCSFILQNFFDRWKSNRYMNNELEESKEVFDKRIIYLAELAIEKIYLVEKKNGEWYRGPLLILMVVNKINRQQLGSILSCVEKNFLLEHLNLVLQTNESLDIKFNILESCDLQEIHLNFILKFFMHRGRIEPFFTSGFRSSHKYIRDDFFDFIQSELPEDKLDKYYALLGINWSDHVFYIFLRLMLSKDLIFNGINFREYILELAFYDNKLAKVLLRMVLKQITIGVDITERILQFGEKVNKEVCSIFLENIKMNETLVRLAYKKGCYLNIINADIENTETIVRLKTKALKTVMETDIYYSYTQSTAKYQTTKDALYLGQLDKVEEAQEKIEQIQERAGNGEYSFDKGEFELWKNEWVSCAKKLQQWDLVQEVANIMGDVDLNLEATLKLPNSFLECDMTKAKTLLDVKNDKSNIYRALINEDIDELIETKIDLVYNSDFYSREREKELLDLQMLMEFKDFNNFKASDFESIRAQSIGLRDRYPPYHSSIDNWNEIFNWRMFLFQRLLKLSVIDSDGIKLKAFHEFAKNYNEMARSMIKNNLPDSALSLLSRIFLLTNIEVTDAYDKIESDIECFIQKKEYTTGLEILNTANLNYFSPLQRSQIFNLKARLNEKLNRNEDAMKIYAQSVQLDYDIGNNWYYWALFLENIYIKLTNPESSFQKETVEKNMFTAFLEASISCKGEKMNRSLLKLVSLFPNPVLYSIFESKIEMIDFTAYFFYIPQLFKILTGINTIAYLILSNIARSHPQAIYTQLRSILVEKYMEAIERGEYLEEDDFILKSIVGGITYLPYTNTVKSDEEKHDILIQTEKDITERTSSLKTIDSNLYNEEPSFEKRRNENRVRKTAEEIFTPKYHSLLQIAKASDINLILNLEQVLEIFIFKSKRNVDERMLKLLRGVLDLALEEILSSNKKDESIKLYTIIERAYRLFEYTSFPKEFQIEFYKSFYGRGEIKLEEFILHVYLWCKIVSEHIINNTTSNKFEQSALELFNKDKTTSSLYLFSSYFEILESYDNLIKIESIESEVVLRKRHGNYKRTIVVRGDDGKKYNYTLKKYSKKHLFVQERECKQLYHYLSKDFTINLKRRKARVGYGAQIEIDNTTIMEEQKEKYLNLKQISDNREKENIFLYLETLEEITGKKNMIVELRKIRQIKELESLCKIIKRLNLNINVLDGEIKQVKIIKNNILDDDIKKIAFERMINKVGDRALEKYIYNITDSLDVYFAYKMNFMTAYALDSAFFLMLGIPTKKPSCINLIVRSCLLQYKNYIVNSKKNDIPFRLTPSIQRYFKKEGILGTFYSVVYFFLEMIEDMNQEDIKIFVKEYKNIYKKEDVKEMIKKSMDREELAKRDVLWQPWL